MSEWSREEQVTAIQRSEITSWQLRYVKPNTGNFPWFMWQIHEVCLEMETESEVNGQHFIYIYWFDTCHGHTQTNSYKTQPLMNYGFAFLQEKARLASISFWAKFTI